MPAGADRRFLTYFFLGAGPGAGAVSALFNGTSRFSARSNASRLSRQ